LDFETLILDTAYDKANTNQHENMASLVVRTYITWTVTEGFAIVITIDMLHFHARERRTSNSLNPNVEREVRQHVEATYHDVVNCRA